MRTAADGRARTHHLSERQCPALLAISGGALRDARFPILDRCNEGSWRSAAGSGLRRCIDSAAAAAAEVTRLADQLAVARHSAAIRPAHLNAELKAERGLQQPRWLLEKRQKQRRPHSSSQRQLPKPSCASQTTERSVFTRTIAALASTRAAALRRAMQLQADGVHHALCGDGASLRWVWLEAWRNARSSTPRHRGLPRPMLVQPCLSRRVYRGVGTSAYSLCKSGAVWWRC